MGSAGRPRMPAAQLTDSGGSLTCSTIRRKSWTSGLVVAHSLKGKRIHDAHLLATMKANGVSRLLTCNAADVPPDSDITILTPGL
jgi:hypothetical protein